MNARAMMLDNVSVARARARTNCETGITSEEKFSNVREKEFERTRSEVSEN